MFRAFSVYFVFVFLIFTSSITFAEENKREYK